VKVKVTGNIISKNGVTLFMADGTSQVFASDDYKIQGILDAIVPALGRQEHPEIDLDSFSIAKRLEQATNGAIKIEENGSALKITTQHGTINDENGALRQHVEDAAVNGGGKALQNFLQRFAGMSKERKHSAKELLHFMKVADLPIADDGSIIGYKVLMTLSEGVMTDPHTGKVKQTLGSLVFMPASKVDDDRRTECSTGLHIANRHYLNGFWGSNRKLCLVKIKPDDVIAVPHSENKMRVCAYHIVHVFTDDEARDIVNRNGRNVSEIPSAAQAVANVVAGNHPPIWQRVEVGSQGEHKVTDLAKPERKAKEKKTRGLHTVVKTVKATVASARAKLKAALPYEQKLAKAQKLYDDGASIREIAKELGMDRESLGKNLTRKAGR
jgi:hypothetical protein